MEIILQKDYISLGYEGDICKVKGGYARNYLIPQKIAVEKTPAALKTLELMQKSLEKKRAKRKVSALELKEKIGSLTIELKMKVADGARLYGSVSQQTILDSLKEQGIEVHKRDIHLEKHIKQLGTYSVEVKLYHDVIAPVSIVVLSDSDEQPVVEEASAPAEVEAAAETTATETTAAE